MKRQSIASFAPGETAAAAGMVGQFRESAFGRLCGYDEVNDADRLAGDLAMRWIVAGNAITKQAASASQMGRFETEILARDHNFATLACLI